MRDLLFSRVTNAFNTLAGLGVPVTPYDPATPSDPNPIAVDNCQITSAIRTPASAAVNCRD